VLRGTYIHRHISMYGNPSTSVRMTHIRISLVSMYLVHSYAWISRQPFPVRTGPTRSICVLPRHCSSFHPAIIQFGQVRTYLAGYLDGAEPREEKKSSRVWPQQRLRREEPPIGVSAMGSCRRMAVGTGSRYSWALYIVHIYLCTRECGREFL